MTACGGGLNVRNCRALNNHDVTRGEMHFELALVEALCEVPSKNERFDLLDCSTTVAVLLEGNHAHASDYLMHLRCDLCFQAAIPSLSHSRPLRNFYFVRFALVRVSAWQPGLCAV